MFAGTKREPRREHALSLIDEVGLTERAKHRPHRCRRSDAARRDRPCPAQPAQVAPGRQPGNLDSVTGATIMDLFEQIRDESGTTVVMVTHDEEMAARADRTIRLRDGLIVPPGGAGMIGMRDALTLAHTKIRSSDCG